MPEENVKVVATKIPVELHREIKVAAAEAGQTLKAFVIAALEKAVQTEE